MNRFLLTIPALLIARLALGPRTPWSWSLDLLALAASLAALAAARHQKAQKTEHADPALEPNRRFPRLAVGELERILELSQDVICITTFDGRFKFVNGALGRRLGWSAGHIESRPFLDLVLPDDRQPTIEAMSVLAEGKSVHGFENRYPAIDGSIVWFSWSSTPDLENRLIYAIAHDVTEKKRFEHELERAKDDAERANRTKSEFLANMSHEIRTPLNAVAGFGELLAAVLVDDKQRRYAESIQEAGRNLLVLLNDILDLSKIEAGMMKLELGPVSLTSMLEELGAIFSRKAAGKELAFDILHGPGFPPFLQLDGTRLRQVLLNLVGNAIKFTRKGSVALEAELTATHPDSVDLSIHVRDTGIGIPSEDLQSIFDLFRQQQGHAEREFGGTGLGLALSRRLVQIMGGELTVESRLGEGSVFSVHLPGVRTTSEPQTSITIGGQRQFDPDRAAFDEARILVVDDIESNRELLVEILGASRFEVVQARDGEEAIRRANQAMPDLILMDIRMPVMDGKEANRRLKQDPATATIPVVALTASVTANEVAALRNAGFQAVLGKPIVVADLLATLGEFIPWRASEALVAERRSPLPLSAEQPGNAIEYLRRDLLPRYEKSSVVVEMDKLRLLAFEIEEKGDRFGTPALRILGERLANAVEYFDIPAIHRTRTELERFADSLDEEGTR